MAIRYSMFHIVSKDENTGTKSTNTVTGAAVENGC